MSSITLDPETFKSLGDLSEGSEIHVTLSTVTPTSDGGAIAEISDAVIMEMEPEEAGMEPMMEPEEAPIKNPAVAKAMGKMR